MSRQFHTTRWTIVIAAGKRDAPGARAALETLCTAYWYPLYAFARHRGRSRQEAQDLTQAFFADLIEKHTVEAADRTRGRFRAFLLGAFKRFASKERDRERAQKRGGGQAVLRLDFEEGERRYALEPAHDLTPERVFDRQWVLTLLEEVLDRLRDEMAAEGKGVLFEELTAFITGAGDLPAYREVAGRLGMTEGAVKVVVHRLRGRYRAILRGAIADTVETAEEVDGEIRDLLRALGGG